MSDSKDEFKGEVYPALIGGIAFAGVWTIVSYITGVFSWLPGVIGGIVFTIVWLVIRT